MVTTSSGTRSATIQVKTRSITNKQGCKLGSDIIKKKGNPNLFVALVELRETGFPDVWIYEYDALAERISVLFANYIATPKKVAGRE